MRRRSLWSPRPGSGTPAAVIIAFGLGLLLTMIGAFRLALFLAAVALIYFGLSKW